MSINRRRLLSGGCAALAATSLTATSFAATAKPMQLAAKLPRWRGFNLLEKFVQQADRPYEEWDFQFCAGHGFDYMRLPLDYRIWTRADGSWIEQPLREIDRAVAFGRRYGIHVTICLHRAPGYCINPPKEELDLWSDGQAQRQFAAQWRMFATRYAGIPPEQLSFNLLNEAPDIDEGTYAKVVRIGVEAIRAVDPNRLIIADGRGGGRKPTYALASLGIAQAGRGYEPFHLTHYRAPWVDGSETWPVPTWPLQDGETRIDTHTLWREQIAPWFKLESLGAGVLIGEWGAYSFTPHPVVMAWMKDCLDNWRRAGWGWSLWNLKGSFGIIDSERGDVAYATVGGRKIDTEMLQLLQAG